MIPMDKKRILTLAGTLVLAGAVVAAGVYGPSVWKVFRPSTPITDSVAIQTPPVNSGTDSSSGTNGSNGTLPNSTAPPGTSNSITPAASTVPNTSSTSPQGEGSTGKYKEPDTKFMDLAPSVTKFFGDDALSNDAKTIVFGAAWNIHEYVDGYLFGPTAGPQMNEQDIKKYIVFHKTLLDKQLKNEPNAAKVSAFTGYLDLIFNQGIDAFDSKDKVRIEQFHQAIHDLDTHLMRNDVSSKIYGATPFATKR